MKETKKRWEKAVNSWRFCQEKFGGWVGDVFYLEEDVVKKGWKFIKSEILKIKKIDEKQKFKEKWMYTLYTAFARAGLIEKRDNHCGGEETIGKTRFRFSDLIDFIEYIPLQKARDEKLSKLVTELKNEKIKRKNIAKIVSWAINISKKNPNHGFIHQATDKIINIH